MVILIIAGVFLLVVASPVMLIVSRISDTPADTRIAAIINTLGVAILVIVLVMSVLSRVL